MNFSNATFSNNLITQLASNFYYQCRRVQRKMSPLLAALSARSALYMATSVYPEMLQPVTGGLFSAESDFLVPNLVSASTHFQIFEINLIFIEPPSVRQDCIWRYYIRAKRVLGEAIVFSNYAPQKLHYEKLFYYINLKRC
jgi:hypothetical protein